MPDIIIEKESKFKKLNKSEKDELATTICGWWSSFHDKRSSQLKTADEIQKFLSLNQPDRNTGTDANGESNAWRSNIKENEIFTTWDSMKSVMWKEIWSNEDQMFDVTGTSKETEEVAEMQKEAIVYALKKMDAGIQFDSATDYWASYGEFIYKTDWKKVSKKVRRFDAYNGFFEQELPIEENANIEAINPMFFNFDVAKYKYGNKKSWDSCPKIYKRFATIEDIKQNPLYTLTKEQIQELEKEDNTSVVQKETDEPLALKTQYGDEYEVLYLHGDIKFNGVLYKNIVAEVFAGRYLIYFEENPVYICPFVWDALLIDNTTGRGISPLKPILEMCKAKENLTNTYGDIAQLNANPPMWSNDTFLKEKYKSGVITRRPGKIFEYENSYTGSFPQGEKFDAGGIGEMISLLANNISDCSSINANVMGNIEQGKRTATEMQLARNGSDSRIAMKLDKIYQINLRVIENVAELLAMFKNGSEVIFVNDKGKRVEVEITNAIRQSQYNYVYEDRNALIDRRQKFQEAFSLLNAAGQNQELAQMIDWKEALKTGLEMTGFDNPDKFFKPDDEITQIADYVRQLPPELQGAIMQNLQPMLQQAQVIMEGMNEQENKGIGRPMVEGEQTQLA